MEVSEKTATDSDPKSSAGYSYHNYDQPDPPHQPMYLKYLVQQLRQINAKQVLDVGCGDGNFTASLADEGFEAYGIDLSKGGISIATPKYPKVKFAVASAYDDFTSVFPGIAKFDAIVSVEVIEHLYSPRDFVRSAKAALKPGGVVIVTTPYWGYLKNVLMAMANRTDRALTALWDGGHIKHWSVATLTKLFVEQKFEFVSFYGAGRPIPYLWNGMAMTFRNPG